MNSDISRDITVKELLESHPQLLQVFLDMRLLCAGCPAEAFHTLAEVAHEYHLDLDKLLNRIDTLLQENKTSQKLFTQQKAKETNNNCDILK